MRKLTCTGAVFELKYHGDSISRERDASMTQETRIIIGGLPLLLQPIGLTFAVVLA